MKKKMKRNKMNECELCGMGVHKFYLIKILFEMTFEA